MRARTVKPGLLKNEGLAEGGPYAVLLFEGLWMLADREGRLEDRPKRIKAECLPYFDVDADALLDWLQTASFIVRYEVDGTRYIEVSNFRRHQNPHPREAPSAIPAPPRHDQGNAEVVPSNALPSLSSIPSGPSFTSLEDPPQPRALHVVESDSGLDAVYQQFVNLLSTVCGWQAPSVQVGEQLLEWAHDVTLDDVARIQAECESAIDSDTGRRGSRWQLVRTIAGRVAVDRRAKRDPWAQRVKQLRGRPPNAMQATPAQRDRFKAIVVTGVDADGKPIREVAP